MRSATDEELGSTLESLRLYPRAVVNASTVDDADASALLEQAHSQGIAVEEKKVFDESAAKK